MVDEGKERSDHSCEEKEGKREPACSAEGD